MRVSKITRKTLQNMIKITDKLFHNWKGNPYNINLRIQNNTYRNRINDT